MKLFPGTETENEIMRELAGGAVPRTDLVASLMAKLSISERGAYKAITGLIESQIIYSTKGQLGLYSIYIENLRKYTSLAERSYFTEQNLAEILPKFANKSSVTLHFETHDELNTYWNQIGPALLTKVDRPTPYIFYGNILSWPTIMPEEAFVYIDAIKRLGYQPFFCLTEQHQRDSKSIQKMKKMGVKVSLVDSGLILFGHEGNIVGDYIIDVTYEKKSMQNFLDVYRDERQMVGVNELNLIPGGSINIKRSKEKARKLTKRFLAYFKLDPEIRACLEG